MIVTAYNSKGKPQVSVNVSDKAVAAHNVMALQTNHAFVKVSDGAWSFVIQQRVKASFARLLHIIETRADVVLA